MKKRYWLVLVLACTGATAILWLWLAPALGLAHAPQHAARTIPRPTPETETESDRRRGFSMPASLRADAHPSASPAGHVVIEDVRVDKSEVCRGEQVIVTVTASSKDDGESYLSFEVVGRPDLVGPRFALRLDESLEAGGLKVFARGKYGDFATFDVPAVRVEDCEQATTLEIELQRRADVPDRAWLSARIAERGQTRDGAAFEPVQYVWDFGDGSELVTTEPEVVHSYEARRQGSAFSYFLVTVTASDAKGATVVGARTLRFVNLGFGPLAFEDRVAIFSGVERQATGGEKIWIYHGAPYDVKLVRARVKDLTVDANGREQETIRDYEPDALLGVSRLPSGTSLTLRDLTHLEPESPEQTRIIEVFGETPDGKPASGAFTLAASEQADPRDNGT